MSRQVCEDLADRLEDRGWRVIRASSKLNRPARLLEMAWTALARRRDYDVANIDVFSGPSFIWAESVSVILKVLRKPYVCTLHGGRLPQLAERWPWRVARLLQNAISVVAPSQYLVKRMKPWRGDIVQLPNPLELKSYVFRLRVNPKPRLVWLRAFREIYNPSMAVDVLAELSRSNPRANLIMVGPDGGDNSLEETYARAKALGVEDRVEIFEGVAKAEVPRFLETGDVFLNTTNADNTPVSVLEALACGLCVVSTDVGGIRYLLENKNDALLVPQDDPDAMALAVRRILADPDLASRLSGNGRRKAEQHDWEVVIPQWEALLRGVAAGSVAAVDAESR